MALGTLATDIKKTACKFTGVNVNYKKTTTFSDGTAMSDDKCDGTIYRKLGADYYVDCDFLDGKFLQFERFGGKADGITDNSPMIKKALSAGFASGSTFGNRIEFGKGTYYFSEAIQLKAVTHLRGKSNGKYISGQTTFKFPSGVDGIVANKSNTYGNNKVSAIAGSSEGSQIQGIHIEQAITLNYITTQDSNFGRVLGIMEGSTFAVGKEIKVLGNGIDNTTGEIAIKANATVSSVITGQRYLTLEKNVNGFVNDEIVTGGTSGATAQIAFVGRQANVLMLYNVSGTFAVNETITGGTSSKTGKILTSVAAPTSYNKVYELSGLTGSFIRSDVWIPKEHFGSAIKPLSRITVRDCYFRRWSYFGIQIISGGTAGVNANCGHFENISMRDIQVHGLYVQGSDANASNFININSIVCGGFSIYDQSFLGNYFFGCHTSSSIGGAYAVISNTSAGSLISCYSEGGNALSGYINKGNMLSNNVNIIGGNHGAPAYTVATDLLTEDDWTRPNHHRLQGRSLDVLGLRTHTSGDVSLYTGGNDSSSNMFLYKRGSGDYSARMSFLKSVNNEDVFGDDVKLKKLIVGEILFGHKNSGDTTTMSIFARLQGGTTSSNNLSSSGASFQPYVTGGNLTEIICTYAGVNLVNDVPITGTGQYAGLVAEGVVSGGRVVKVNIITPPTAQGALRDTVPAKILDVSEKGIIPATAKQTLGNSANKFLEAHTEKIFLAGTEIKKTAASADTAAAVGATYSQSEVQAILTELRDLKAKMRTSGLLA